MFRAPRSLNTHAIREPEAAAVNSLGNGYIMKGSIATGRNLEELAATCAGWDTLTTAATAASNNNTNIKR